MSEDEIRRILEQIWKPSRWYTMCEIRTTAGIKRTTLQYYIINGIRVPGESEPVKLKTLVTNKRKSRGSWIIDFFVARNTIG